MDLGGHQQQQQQQQHHHHHQQQQQHEASAGSDLGPYESKLNKLLLVTGQQQQQQQQHGNNNGIPNASSSDVEVVTPGPTVTSNIVLHPHTTTTGTSKKNVHQSNKVVHYRECLKNHAASIGGHALDGCGDFMPSGEEGTIEALKCAACDCHRNFHRREVEGEPLVCDICHMNRRDRNRRAAAITAGVLAQQSSQQQQSPSTATTTTTPAGGGNRAMSLLALTSRSSGGGGGGGGGGEGGGGEEGGLQVSSMHHHHHLMSPLSMKKRFRTKFSMDQKERMYMFAEKVGWRIQKHDEAAVQQFCAEVGVKRHVLKVWMHNNKHTFGKRPMVAMLPSPSPSPQTPNTTSATLAAAVAAAAAAAASSAPPAIN